MTELGFIRNLPRAVRGSGQAPLLLSDKAASRSLAAIIAILTFLAALAAGGADIVAVGSADWRSSISREATIQLRPLAGRDTETDLARVAAIARSSPGIADSTPVSRAEAEGLLEPWLGRGLDLASLPVPRIVVLKLAPRGDADLPALAARIGAEIPGATIDDHARWLSRLSAIANTILAVALVLIGLVLAGSALAVAFATRGAMAGSRDVVEVLHLVGADDRFVARQFASRFLRLGISAAALGAGGAALAILCLGQLAVGTPRSAASEAQLDAFFGAFILGARGYLLLIAVAMGVVALVGLVSRWTAKRFLLQIYGQ